MEKKKCSYCEKSNIKLTKEHIINKALLNRYYIDGTGYVEELKQVKDTYRTIKDVCPRCNNDVLSKLDTYFLNWCNTNLPKQRIIPNKTISFNYDFNNLSRWLMKTLYNSERKIKKLSLDRYKKFIIGENKRDKYFKIYVEVISDLPVDEANKIALIKERESKKINILKMGSIETGISDIHRIRYFLIDNLVFHVIIFNPDNYDNNVISKIISDYKKALKNDNIAYLNPMKSQLNLKTSKKTIIEYLNLTIEGTKSMIENRTG